MNKTEHLLTCLAEECAEVQQAVAKALRFWLDDGYPDTDRTNAKDISFEVCDLIAVVEMLCEANILKMPPNKHARIAQKKEKVSHYMEYAEQRGTLVHNAEVTGGPLAARPVD